MLFPQTLQRTGMWECVLARPLHVTSMFSHHLNTQRAPGSSYRGDTFDGLKYAVNTTHAQLQKLPDPRKNVYSPLRH